VDAILAVRRYEHDTYADLTDDELTQRFRMSWSV
jgi:glutamine synthetase